jgi:chaperonin GroEL (HSP60 family)
MCREGFKLVDHAGAHPIALKKGLDKALKVVLEFLKNVAMPVSTD